MDREIMVAGVLIGAVLAGVDATLVVPVSSLLFVPVSSLLFMSVRGP